jgi:beta-aspartyl-peptidase (threonine type)
MPPRVTLPHDASTLPEPESEVRRSGLGRGEAEDERVCDDPFMRHLGVVLVLLASAGCRGGPTFGPADDRAVRAVLEAQRDAWNRGDLDSFMAGYERTAELVFTSGGNIRRGWQDTYDRYRAKYGKERSTMGHLAFDILAVQPLGAEGAIVLGRWRLTETARAAGGVFSVALRRTDSGWHVVHDHTSADGP